MHPVKRIEIISTEIEMDKILDILDKLEVPGYTFIPNVQGKSRRGTVDDDLVMSKLGNAYVICCCPPELVKPIVEKIKPLLNKFGGVCYISDAMEIRSLKCVASL